MTVEIMSFLVQMCFFSQQETVFSELIYLISLKATHNKSQTKSFYSLFFFLSSLRHEFLDPIGIFWSGQQPDSQHFCEFVVPEPLIMVLRNSGGRKIVYFHFNFDCNKRRPVV